MESNRGTRRDTLPPGVAGVKPRKHRRGYAEVPVYLRHFHRAVVGTNKVLKSRTNFSQGSFSADEVGRCATAHSAVRGGTRRGLPSAAARVLVPLHNNQAFPPQEV